MIISEVEIFDVKLTPIVSNWNPVIVRINTDEGVSGVGEVGLAYGTGSAAGVGMVRNLAEQFLMGKDPLQAEYLWDLMYRHTFWGLGGGPVVYGGMSAIDQALWDIKGKAFGMPVYQLLGGRCRGKLRAYASQIQFGWSEDMKPCVKPEDYAEASQKAVSEGYTAVKVDPFGYDLEGRWGAWDLREVLDAKRAKLFYERIKAIREEVGTDIDILIEAHSFLGTRSAIQVGKLFEEFKPFFYEEPIHSMNVDCMEKVARNVNIPIAAGERIYTRYGFRQYVEKQVLDIVQPDIGLAGGITETKKVADYAATYDILVQCHVCGGPIATAAALQLEACIPNFAIHEYHVVSLRKENCQLVKQALKPKKGYFEIPDTPGLGVELKEDVITQYPCIRVTNPNHL